MLALTRETLLNRLELLPGLMDAYQQRSFSFPEEAIIWLAETENALMRLRHPLVGLLASERAKIAASQDGVIDTEIRIERLSKTKCRMGTAVVCLNRAQKSMTESIAVIDKQLGSWKEKMAQFLAVATTKQPIPLPPTEPKRSWLLSIWSGFEINGEIQGMYQYLNTTMDISDRLFILEELIDNLTAPTD